MSFHWSNDATGTHASTLCGLTVLSPWCARSYRTVTCAQCRSRINLIKVICPVVVKVDGTRVRGCGEETTIGKTKITRSFLRLCPNCVDRGEAGKLPAVMDEKGNKVILAPDKFLAGMSGEDDEVRKGIKVKENG